MNSLLLKRLKEGRVKKGLKQSDVYKLTGIKNTTLSNYENGITEPDMDTFLLLCNLYDLDYAALIGEAYSYQSESIKFLVGDEEKDLIKRYRDLDEHGKRMVDMVLAEEHRRCLLEKDIQMCKEKYGSKNNEGLSKDA